MDFVGKRKIWYVLSLIIIISGFISLITQGLNLGIDFVGGNLVQIQFENDVNTEEIRKTLKKIKLDDSIIQSSENNIFLIKTKVMEQSEQENMINVLENDLGNLEILRSEKVGPTIGKELRVAGISSLVIAIFLMVIYISFRFEFKFALAAIGALIHDILVTLGIFSILQIEIDSAFIAAVLTIFGYSINDTIVIFDRIRENLKKAKKEELPMIVNKSIKETLTRSINTTLTTLLVLFFLYFLGGETIKVFVLALIIGITSGAYSSIFTASQLWIDLKNLGKRKNVKANA